MNKVDYKAATETAINWAGLGYEDLANPQASNLASAYLELRELARDVLRMADRDTDIFNALRAALGEEL